MTAPAPELLIADDWRDYRLLDSGNGGKLEQVGPYRFVRPEPQALWTPALSAAEWDGADGVFAPAASGDEDAGRWRFNRELPPSWTLHWDDIAFLSTTFTLQKYLADRAAGREGHHMTTLERGRPPS